MKRDYKIKESPSCLKLAEFVNGFVLEWKLSATRCLVTLKWQLDLKLADSFFHEGFKVFTARNVGLCS